MTTNLKIAKASLILISASIVGHVLSLGKEVLVAKFFGVSRDMDALYAALTIPNFCTNLLLLMFGIMFMPLFIKHSVDNKQEADYIASTLMNWIMIALAAISAALFLFPSQIVSACFSGLDRYTLAQTAGILRIFSITILFSGIAGMLTYLLNAYEHFSWPAFSQIFITAGIVIFMVLFVSSWGIYTIVWGTTCGLALQAALLVFLAARKGFKYRPVFSLSHPALKEISASAGLVVAITVLSSLNSIVNRSMSSYLPAGSIAALAYADKLVQVPLIIFAGSINTAVYPFFALQIAHNRIDELKETLASSIKMSGLIFIPVTLIFLIFSKPLIHALFQRGAFDSSATAITSAVFVCFSFQLIAYYAMVIMMRLLFAFQDYKGLIGVLLVNILSNMAFNLIFMKMITPPAAGIALSTSLVCFLTTGLLFGLLKRKMEYLHGISILKSLLGTAVLAIISAAAMYGIFRFLDASVPYSTVNQLGIIFISSVAGLLLFAVLGYLARFEEMLRLLRLIRGKVIPSILF